MDDVAYVTISSHVSAEDAQRIIAKLGEAGVGAVHGDDNAERAGLGLNGGA